MNEILIYILIGIGLSIDAFTMAITYGIVLNKNVEKILLCTIIGLFHFIMPICGYLTAGLINEILIIDTKYITIFIFLILILGMIKSSDEKEVLVKINIVDMILLGLGVSIDSFSVGIAIALSKSKITLASSLFSIISATTTYIGIKIGEYITKNYRNKAKWVGVTLFILVILKYIFLE